MTDEAHAVEHWLGLPGQDSLEAKAHVQMREHSSEAGLREHDERDAEIGEAVRAAYSESQRRSDEEADWNASASDRKYFAEKYPDAKLSDILRNAHLWEDQFARDPLRTAENFRRQQWRASPFERRKNSAPVVETPPADLIDARAKDEWQRTKDVRDAVAQVAEQQRDRSDYEATKTYRARWNERNGGKHSAAHALAQLRQIDELAERNPDEAAHKIAMRFGAPATQGELQERQAAAQQAAEQHQQAQATAENYLAQLEQTNRLPSDYKQLEPRVAEIIEHAKQDGFPASDPRNWDQLMDFAIKQARTELHHESLNRAESAIDLFRRDHGHYDKLEPLIADLLQTGLVQRTGNHLSDLQQAYNWAFQMDPEISAQRSRAAARSISGGPSSDA